MRALPDGEDLPSRSGLRGRDRCRIHAGERELVAEPVVGNCSVAEPLIKRADVRAARQHVRTGVGGEWSTRPQVANSMVRGLTG
jgi:hypothetical protein